MKRGVWSLLAWVALCTPSEAMAQNRVTLEPGSQWVVDYAEERCSLVRQYVGKNTMWLRIDSFGQPQNYRMMVWGEDIPASLGPLGKMRYRLVLDEAWRDTQAEQGFVGKSHARFIATNFGPADLADEREEQQGQETQLGKNLAEMRTKLPAIAAFRKRVENIEFQFTDNRTFDLHTGAMDKPLDALDLCTDDLVQSWGLNLAQQQSLTRNPIPALDAVKRLIENFPYRMARQGISSHVPVRIMVDADGTATSCVIQIEGIEENFRERVCRYLSEPYQPALDANGDPVSSVFLTSVVFLVR